ncbi:hypothetical protein D3C80_1198580 [compost metagenome]
MFQNRDTLDRQTTTAALIGIGGVRETVTQHHSPAGQRRADDLRQVLGASGEHQQQLGVGRHAFVAGRQQQFTHLFRQRRTAWLTGQHHVQAVLAQARGQVVAIGALAGA